MGSGLIDQHDLWTDDQKNSAEEVISRLNSEGIRLVRMAWGDTHGCSRVKEVSIPVFLNSLINGYNINVATYTLDATGGRVFRSFVPGGGMDLKKMTGSPNLIIVPDPTTFQILHWAPGIAWVLCNEYFDDFTPFHFSSRLLLQNQVNRLKKTGMEMRVGLEVEWYLRRIEQDHFTPENTGVPGRRGQPIKTLPVEPGYLYHSESNFDIMQPILSELAEAYMALKLPLRSIENEYGPGQIECTFEPQTALRAADDYLLFRTVTKQICRRNGYFATFMCKPAFEGFYTSGWHLHQSLIDKTNSQNLFMPENNSQTLSNLGSNFLAGLLENAQASTVFASPTINGYHRFHPNSLAPDRATWSHDHRGVMVRVLGGFQDTSTRLENRIGEPAANPYLFIASQIIAGIDGIERKAIPWPADDDPYNAERPKFPKTLSDALTALEGSQLFRDTFGDIFIRYFLALKRAELSRFEQFIEHNSTQAGENGVSQWEQNEYFDFF